MNNQKGIAHIALLAIVLIAVGAGGWWMWKNDKLNVAVEGPTSTPTSVPNTATQVKETTNMYTCANETINISFQIPQEWTCESNSLSDTDAMVTAESELYRLVVGNMGRGGPCGSGPNPNCIQEDFFENGQIELNLYFGNTEKGEVFGSFKTETSSPWISLTYKPGVEKTFENLDPQEENKIKEIFSTLKLTDQDTDETNKQTDNESITSERIINHSQITGWPEFTSSTGYTFQYPTYYSDIDSSGEEFNYYNENDCTLILSSNAGGILTTKVVPYSGGSRRQLVGTESGYEYKFEDVHMQGKNALLIEKGPSGESGSAAIAVIPVGNSALIISEN